MRALAPSTRCRKDYLQTARAKGLRDKGVRKEPRRAERDAPDDDADLPSTSASWSVVRSPIELRVLDQRLSGLLTVDALRGPDIPLLQAAVHLVLRRRFILANLVADMLYGVLDPRVRT